MRRAFFSVPLCLAVALGLAVPLRASIDRGAVQGTVTDQQSAVVPGAKVVIKNLDTGVQVNLTTNSAGFYLAPELVPGKYSVYVLAPGFSPLTISDLVVTANVTTTADAQLRVGPTTQKVEVTASAEVIQSSSANFSTSLEKSYVAEIPLVGRDIQGLVQLIPGMTQSSGPSGVLFGFNSEFGVFPDPMHFAGSNVSANGGQGGANAWYLDGTMNNDAMVQSIAIDPSPEAVAEFNVVNNGLAAEWGRTSGAVVNVVLKSGTNKVHGDIYEFNRNSWFSATNPFAERNAQGVPFLQPAVTWNDFGGTFGGPVYLPHIYNGKNRTFVFASWDVSMLHERKPLVQTVPLPGEAEGNFTADPRYAAACNPAAGITNCLYNPFNTVGPNPSGLYSRTPFTNPVIPANLIDPVGAFYASSYPAPNYLDPLQQGPGGCKNTCNNYIGTVGSSQTGHNISIKIDHTFSEMNKLFGEWLFDPVYYVNFRYPWDGPTAPTQTGIMGAQPYRNIPQIFTLGLTSTVTPTLVNEARVSFLRTEDIATPNPESVTSNAEVLKYVGNLNFYIFPPFQPVPTMSVGGLASFGPQEWQNALLGAQSYNVIDNLTKIIGKHTLKTGFMFKRDNHSAIQGPGFQLSFGGGLTNNPVTGLGGSGLAQLLMGAVDEGSYTGEYHDPWGSMDDWAFYFQDEFRLKSNFTVNVGMRYEIYGWFRERYNHLANMDWKAENPDVPFLGRMDYFATPQHPGRDVYPARLNDWAPRLSFAWSPRGDRKTVIRAGYAIIYSNDNAMWLASGQGVTNSSWGGGGTIQYNGDFSFHRPAFILSQGAPPFNPTLLDLDAVKQEDLQDLGQGPGGWGQGQWTHDAYVQQWTFNIQRQITPSFSVSATYVGSHGLHLDGTSVGVNNIPISTRLSLRETIYNPTPVDPSLAPIYGCPISGGKAMCPGNLVDRPYPEYQGGGPNMSYDGFNRYNSFQLKVEKRYTYGLNFVVAYTNQKNLESVGLTSTIYNFSAPSMNSGNSGRTKYIAGESSCSFSPCTGYAEDYSDLRRYEGLGPDDIPQILNFAITYELPVGQGKAFLSRPGLADKVLGGWKLIQNWNFQSGVPMVFTGPCNGISCYPDLVGDPSAGRSGKNRTQLEAQWYNPAAFTANFGSDPTVIKEVSTGLNPDGTPYNYNSDAWWTFGNSGTRPPTGRAPGYWNADMTLAKDWHVTESRYFQLRWELFNVFNHQNLGIPNSNWCLPPNPDGSTDLVHQFGCQFGKITGVQTDPRSMEFGLKFYW